MANAHKKRCSTGLVIRETLINTRIRCPLGWLLSKETTGETGASNTAGGDAKWCRCFENGLAFT